MIRVHADLVKSTKNVVVSKTSQGSNEMSEQVSLLHYEGEVRV